MALARAGSGAGRVTAGVGTEAGVRTTCPYCGVGCGVIARVEPDGRVTVKGDPDHPANFGKLCSKGAALAETLGLEDRLLHPEVDGQRADWNTALNRVAEGFSRTIQEHGPESVAFYVSGQLLTEAYYVANKLMKGFIGAANIDTNSRLCMSSAVAGHKRAFGADAVPCTYEDLDLADLVVLVGSNAAWCHPVLYRRIADAKRARPEMRVVVIDPRRTDTAELADLHLSIRPGSDAALFNGLLGYLFRNGSVERDFVDRHTQGAGAALSAAMASVPSLASAASQCGVEPGELGEFYDWFAATERTVTVFSQGVNQSSSGTDKVNSIINCHLLTGRIGRPGMGPFSFTGQPNAMGGREVGGLANQLAAHLDFFSAEDRRRVQAFWGAPRMAERPGPLAVDLFEGIGAGRIKAVWIMATNPVDSLPDADRVRRALAGCPLVVVSDCVCATDTTEMAHVLLPASTWGEREGTVTNSERRISRQRAFRAPPGQSRADWWIIAQVARRMGYAEAFAYESPAAIFAEHARLSGIGSPRRRAFDLSALGKLDEAAYDQLAPVQWPVRDDCPQGTRRLFEDGRFYTESGRAQLVAVTPREPAKLTNEDYPLVLNTGRVRDHWHTMTRTGQSGRLSAHTPEPYAEVHPEDAHRHGLAEAGLVRIVSACGEALVRVRISDRQRPGSVFVPMHWTDQFSARARVDSLVAATVDPVSGQPESKHMPVRVEAVPVAWQGFVLSRDRLAIDDVAYWARTRTEHGWRYSLAGLAPVKSWREWARPRLGETGDWVEYSDASRGRYRAARLLDGRLEACLFVAQDGALPAWEGLLPLCAEESLSAVDRLALLSGQVGGARSVPDGPTVCACFSVGEVRILEAIEQHELTTVEAIGAALQAGTNCGSCVPELRRLLQEKAVRRAPV